MPAKFFPSSEEERIKWSKHYCERIAIYAPILKLTVEEVDTHRSLNFFEVHEIVAEYSYLPPWKHQYT